MFRTEEEQSASILLISDDTLLLNSIDRILSGIAIRIITTGTGESALNIVAADNIALVIIDGYPADISYSDLISKLGEVSPDTLKLLLTDDGNMLFALNFVKRREASRIISKPFTKKDMVQNVQDLLAQYYVNESLKRENRELLLAMAVTVELKDPYTLGHCSRVNSYALMLANACGIELSQKNHISYGSLLHDFGKVQTPEHILNKKGPLTSEEHRVIRDHPSWGAHVARNINMSQQTVNIINYHHERFDGRGYPFGIQGDEIPLEARIVTIADIYDALTSTRPYRKKYSEQEALNIMQLMKNKILDPELVDMFIYDCLHPGRKKNLYQMNDSYNNSEKIIDLIMNNISLPSASGNIEKSAF